MDRRIYDRRCSEPYIGFIHCSHLNDLMANGAKLKWKAAWRRARRAGVGYMPAQWVLLKYPIADIPTEIGQISSVRFISS